MGCGNSKSVEEKDNNQNEVAPEQNQIQKKKKLPMSLKTTKIIKSIKIINVHQK